MMRGVNPYHEEAMSAFEKLSNTVDRLVKLGLSEDHGKLYKKAINNSHSYIKNYFPYNIKMESDIGSHCVKFSLSDPNNKVSFRFGISFAFYAKSIPE